MKEKTNERILVYRNEYMIRQALGGIDRIKPYLQRVIDEAVKIDLPLPELKSIYPLVNDPVGYYDSVLSEKVGSVEAAPGFKMNTSKLVSLLEKPDLNQLVSACEMFNRIQNQAMAHLSLLHIVDGKVEIIPEEFEKYQEKLSTYADSEEAKAVYDKMITVVNAINSFSDFLEKKGLGSCTLQNIKYYFEDKHREHKWSVVIHEGKYSDLVKVLELKKG